MTREIKKAAVIGAGVMGAGIAAQLANAGIEVELLDILPKADANGVIADRDARAKDAVEKMLKTNPAPFMHKSNAKKIRPGNVDDHMSRISDCDLVIEVVFENPEVKSATFKKIDEHRKEGSIVASNTSTIPLQKLIDGQSEQFKKDFVITHFFNPPRYMQLLELIVGKDTSADVVPAITKFMDERMGKGVVVCNDTPGFIANRIGTFWIQTAMNEAFARNIKPEEADVMMGRPIGVPKTGVFGLADLVGLDLMPNIRKSLLSSLPDNDAYRAQANKHATMESTIDKMIADGYTGRKGKGGFYRLNPESKGSEKEKQTVDLATGQYRKSVKPKLKAAAISKKKGLKGLFAANDAHSQYTKSVLMQVLHYTASLVPEIAGDIVAVDTAMKLGYNWKYGPFELIDKIGVDNLIGEYKKAGMTVPPMLAKAENRSFYRSENGKLQYMGVDGAYTDVVRPEGVLLLSDIKRASKPVASNKSASLWNIGDGVLCLEFHSKMNSLDGKIMDMINTAIKKIGDGQGKNGGEYKALVIHNESDDFSVGANLGLAMVALYARQYWLVENLVQKGQDTYKALKYAPFPSVAAPAGKALGGGCEILLHTSHVAAHAETYMGLVEVGVGLIPGWGGCAEMTARAQSAKKMPKGPMPPLAKTFETLSTAKVGLSAFEGKDLLYLRESDSVVMNKARLLASAKQKALEMVAAGYTPSTPADNLLMAGPAGREALRLAVDGFYQRGMATTYDVVVSDRLADVLTGGPDADITKRMHEDQIRELERTQFSALIRDKRTLARVKHILTKGKPLREKPVAGLSSRKLRDDAAANHGVMAKLSAFFTGGKASKADFGKAASKPCCGGHANKNDKKPGGDAPKKAA